MRLLEKLSKHHTTTSSGEFAYLDFVSKKSSITDDEFKGSTITLVPKTLFYKTHKTRIESEGNHNYESYAKLGLDVQSLLNERMNKTMDSLIEKNAFDMMQNLGYTNPSIDTSVNKPIRRGILGFFKTLLSKWFSISWKDEFILNHIQLRNHIMRISNQGFGITRIDKFNTIIVSTKIASFIADSPEFVFSEPTPDLGIIKIGSIHGIEVFVNPHMDHQSSTIVYGVFNDSKSSYGNIHYIFKERTSDSTSMTEDSTLTFVPGASSFFFTEVLPIHKSFI